MTQLCQFGETAKVQVRANYRGKYICRRLDAGAFNTHLCCVWVDLAVISVGFAVMSGCILLSRLDEFCCLVWVGFSVMSMCVLQCLGVKLGG